MGGDNSSIGFCYTQCFDLANNSAVYQPLGSSLRRFNSLDRYLSGSHDQPCQAVVVSAALGESLRGLGPGSLHEVSMREETEPKHSEEALRASELRYRR